MKTVTLHDGRQVDSSSEEWRHECEARAILSWPIGQRRDYLEGVLNSKGEVMTKGVLQHRKQPEVTRLKETMMALWIDKQARQLANMDEYKRETRMLHLSRDNTAYIMGRIQARMGAVMAANDNNQADMFGT
jgi:hypothetical protein